MAAFENEVDLRPFILAIINRWKTIVLVAFVSSILGLSLGLLRPRQYEATATILLTRSRATLSLADQFPTVTEPIDNRSRMEALIAIATSNSLSIQTYELLKDSLPADQLTIRSFRESVEVRTVGDAIQVRVNSSEPQVAANIANTWAKRAVAVINQAYGEEQPVDEIIGQLELARIEYQTAQGNLESFIETNQIEILTKQVEEAKALLSNLASTRTWRILYYTERKQNIEIIINELEGLQKQVETDNSSIPGDSGDALAVLFSRALGLESADLQSFNLEIQDLSTLRDSRSSYLADLSTLITIWKTKMDETEDILAGLTDEAFRGVGVEAFEEIAGQVRFLEKQLEIEVAKDLELRSNRELAWEAYQALAQKEVELRNTPQFASIVTLASEAVTPFEPLSRGIVVNTVGGGGFGFLLAIIWILVRHWWQDVKGQEPSKAL